MTLSQKFIVVSKSVFLTIYFFCLSLFSTKNLSKGNSEVIVSLTSYGKRLRFVFLTIETILQQSYPPKCIYLWLHKKDIPSGFSAWIMKKQQRRGLIVNYVDRDTRSYKKLSPVYNIPDKSFDYVVTADDDILYPYHWIEKFKEYYQQEPGYVYCYRARVISLEPTNNTLKKYSDWPLADNKNSLGNCVIPTGVSGICYPKDSISEKVIDYQAIESICPYADDIWYKMTTTLNKFESKLVVDHSTHFIPVLTGFAKGLEKVNVYNDLNSKQFNDSMKYFNLTIADFIINTVRK